MVACDVAAKSRPLRALTGVTDKSFEQITVNSEGIIAMIARLRGSKLGFLAGQTLRLMFQRPIRCPLCNFTLTMSPLLVYHVGTYNNHSLQYNFTLTMSPLLVYHFKGSVNEYYPCFFIWVTNIGVKYVKERYRKS
ncbi:uncharacterized protein BDR25DRAFT_350435 [Lindgomyces ingoldianus]|uniref:Uncharacterized protein n=1 Tax=Lindgomyces ingoldianus TaxID=673940 RepID=A0ACB6RA46_9PLEO|nr:uncharacterized protein BDR25DRAFT_350435 [Lindgomyces ingoldianus]KAF2476144.1 hypothetical protein BDR25DRAFT_350435 [Lindgomyces ingoldianus]